MPAPLIAAGLQVARKVVLRRLIRLGLLSMPFVLVAAVAVGLLTLLVATGGNDSDQSATTGSCTTLTRVAGDGVQGAGLTAEQLANAQAIVAVGRQLHVPAYGWVIAVATALQESSLTNLTTGHLDSLGLFQQRAAWGSDADRLDPAIAARMFYEGGKGGQRGLVKVKDFESMPLTDAAQAVQASALPGAYARWEPLARHIVANPAVLSATCYTAADYTGDRTPGSNAVAAALQVLGTPYSWGGGGIGGPGMGFGPGSQTVGFDCSSLVQYAYFKATGKALPRVTDAQAAALPSVPPGSKLRAGDLLFFRSPGDPPGSYHHVGIYDGQGGMVHAPRTGKTVEVVHDVLKDPYFSSQLALVTRPEADMAYVTQAGATHGRS
jgi:cell wall-associated NlpC family hydrolase